MTILQVKGLGKQKMSELSAKAKRLGTTAARYVRRLVEEDLALDHQARQTTFAEIMRPVREEFRASGMTEADLDAIVDRARTRHHQRATRRRS
jgi:hypothetical protein